MMIDVMNLALFDFDGTVTFKDSFVPFLYYGVDPARFALGRLVLLPVVVSYKLRILSSSATRARLAAFGFRGRREDEIREVGSKFAQDVLPEMVRKKALDRIQWHKAQGDRVVIVSAALDVYLTEWCRRLDVEVICTELEVENGILTGRYRGGDCSGQEKVRRIREKYDLESYQDIYAYGDTNEDDEMLNLASKKYFRWQDISADVGPRPRADRVDTEPDR
jgi:HAD superfamily hydrolase (TIGR01490 family)